MYASPLGNFPIDEFLSDYWQKKPLLLRNALPDIASPVSAELLAGLACEEDVESRIIIQHENDWELLQGPFNEDAFTTLPKSHWTLLVQAVDHWMPEATKFLQQFNFIPRWRIDDLMMSYASDGGGVGPHFDNYDVFLVQTEGKRKWEIGGLCSDDSELVENLPVSILRNFNAQESWILEPGDMLYVPPGFAHNGVAQGDHCITCSVGFRAPSHSEIVREYSDYISEHLSESLRYQDPDDIVQINTGEISRNTIDEIKKILSNYMEDQTLISDWFGRYITTPKYHEEAEDVSIKKNTSSFETKKLKKYLESENSIFRNESSRFAFQIFDENVHLYVDGKCIDTTCESNQDKIECITGLCENIEFSKISFPQTEDNFLLLARLLESGALYLNEE
jgi:50S ribosomal protein L16 3-hydroxylase